VLLFAVHAGLLTGGRTLLERGQTPLAAGLLWVPVVVAALALLMLAMPQLMGRLFHRRAVRAPG
jgi:hypothetical protein